MKIGNGLFPKFWAAFVVIVICVSAQSDTRLYQAELHEAEWTMRASVFECRLSQTIPHYGEGEFYHRAGESLAFRLHANTELMFMGEIALYAVPPAWNYQRSEKKLSELNLEANTTSLQLDAGMAKQLMDEMLTGMMPTFKGLVGDDQKQPLRVGISPLRFQAAYRKYQRCSGALLPVNYDQVGRTSLPWPRGAEQLSGRAKALLDKIVIYSKADSSVTGFEVDSFTDTAGTRQDNLARSEERAFIVTNYLISRGVDPERIATRAHGEREEYLLVNPEKNAADRDRNRRVNVVMLRK